MQRIRRSNYFDKPDVDYEQPALFNWREFYSFRNHVLRVLRIFGSARPLGEVDLSAAEDDQPSFSSEIVKSPEFFVVDDMYKEHDRNRGANEGEISVTSDLLASHQVTELEA